MIPDTVFNSRRLLWAVCVIALPCFFRQPETPFPARRHCARNLPPGLSVIWVQ
jgi:hypothetical protein